jgi:hypothetical protein
MFLSVVKNLCLSDKFRESDKISDYTANEQTNKGGKESCPQYKIN